MSAMASSSSSSVSGAPTDANTGAPSGKNTVLDADRLIEKGAELVEQCHYETAAKFFVRALEQRPNDTSLLEALADVYLQLHNIEAANMLLEKSAAISPDDGAAKWLSLGQIRA